MKRFFYIGYGIIINSRDEFSVRAKALFAIM